MLHALFKRIIVEPIVPPTQSAGGIIMSVSPEKYFDKGIVVSVAEDSLAGIKIGDTIQFKKFQATEVTHENKKYLIVEEDDLLGILH